jgi:hypothetical protein
VGIDWRFALTIAAGLVIAGLTVGLVGSVAGRK